VVTEAMHGAIVADTLRIPWVPVVCSPAILPFKWSDWTRSVELAYRPRLLPPSSGWEALKHLKIRLTDRVHARSRNAAEEDQDLIDDFHRRFGNIAVEDLHPKPALNASKKSAARAMTALFDPIFQARAANALIAAAKSDAYLSDDRIFANRVDRLQDALERLRLGYWTMLREGSLRQDLEATLTPLIARGIDTQRLIVVTDSMSPDDVGELGHMDHVLRRAFDIGIFDAEHEDAAKAAGKEPVEERCARAADVEIAGGTGRESGSDHGDAAHSTRWRRCGGPPAHRVC